LPGTILMTILVLSFIILVHELGHFIAARRAGILCHEFSIGFGPALYSWDDGETHFFVRSIPLGGYVLMAGEVASPAEEGNVQTPYPPAEPGRNLADKSALQRMTVFAAGPATNFLAAMVLFFVIFGVVGIPQPTSQIERVEAGYPAEEAGIEVGDRIAAINGVQTETWEDVVREIRGRPGEETTITVERDGQRQEVSVEIGYSPHEEGIGYIGIQPTSHPVRQSLPAAAIEAVAWTAMVFVMLVEVFINLLGGETEALLGIVGVGAEVGRAAEMGLANVLWTTASISASIGFFQLLPIPALDGSKLLFLLVEVIRGRPLDPRKEGLINFIGFAFLILLVIYITFQDIARLL